MMDQIRTAWWVFTGLGTPPPTSPPYDPAAESLAARTELVRAALRFLCAAEADETAADFDTSLEYAEEELTLAARRLTRAVEKSNDDSTPAPGSPPGRKESRELP